MQTTLNDQDLDPLLEKLSKANKINDKGFPGETGSRQPVHTVYGGAHIFKYTTAKKMGELALRSMLEFAPNFVIFAKVLEFSGAQALPSDDSKIQALLKRLEEDSEAVKKENYAAWLAYTVYNRVVKKITREPIEDFRIDFEDGFGSRSDDEEDATAVQAAKEVARGMKEKTLPPFIGIRVKPFSEELKKRGIRTLDIFLTELIKKTSGKLPENFVVTLPKIPVPEQVEVLVDIFEILEKKHNLEEGALQLELMIEITQSIFNSDGKSNIPLLLKAARGRCRGAHFGTYDYTASANITANYQSMNHPACEFARHMMQNTLAGTPVMLSDGATNVMPIGPNRVAEGEELTFEQKIENRLTVHNAWKLHNKHIAFSLKIGFFQGWDLHPAQLPVRYGAMYHFFLETYDLTTLRLKNFVDKAAQATLVGDVFDDAATGQGLLNYFLRAMSCGAITQEEVLKTGLTLEEIQGRSFKKIMDNRRKK